MGFNIMDLMNGATRAAVEGVDNYEAITLNLDEIKEMTDTEAIAALSSLKGNINSYGWIARAVNHWPGKRGVSSFRWT